MSTPKVLGIGLLCGALLCGWVGCKKETVETDQPAATFETDVEAKLSAFDKRLDDVKSGMSDQAAGVRNTVETATEQAEEKIETLRDSTLPTLREATGEEETDRIKETINTTLDEIDEAITRAEEAKTGAMGEQDAYVDDTSKTLEELRQRYESLKDRAENVEGAVKAEVDQALESAEEAIQEAEDSLPEYRRAAKEEAAEIRDNIDALLSDARDSLDQAGSSLEE